MSAFALPDGLLLAAGAAAALNPCGVAMLPAYLALLLGGKNSAAGGWLGGLTAGIILTAGFLTVFGLVGLVAAATMPLLSRVLPYYGLLVGAALSAAGFFLLLSNRSLGWSGASRLADSLLAAAGPGGPGTYLYGMAYAVASLGCTFPLFASLLGAATTTESLIGTIRSFVLYALGMGGVVTALCLAAVLARRGLELFFRAALPWMVRLSGAVMTVAGLYLLHYWLSGPGTALF